MFKDKPKEVIRRLLPCVCALSLLACTAATEVPVEVADEVSETCVMDIRFENVADQTSWRAVNDGVMGGRSSGGPEFENGVMIFRGVINTNGGGFSSIRFSLTEGAVGEADGLKMMVKSDGRSYKFTMRTDETYRRRPISFQMKIPTTPPGEWSEVMVSFQDAEASIFGRPLSGARFVPYLAWEMGFILADGKDGPFRLEVKRIQACE